MPADYEPAMRVAPRSGLRREGVVRGHRVHEERRADRVLFARLATDPPITEPEAFRELLNSFLPRKRAISQMLVRDPEDRVLLCRLTYKQDWDLPGGVVEINESPREGVTREVDEELSLDIPAGDLVLTDWLPPGEGWDDAVCLVFDGGVHDPAIEERIVPQAREIKQARFCTVAEVHQLCADFTARRIDTALANLAEDAPTVAFSESGRPVGGGSEER